MALIAITFNIIIYFIAVLFLSCFFAPLAEHLQKKNAPIKNWVVSATVLSFSYFLALSYIFHQPHRIDFSGFVDQAILVSSILGGAIAGWNIGKTAKIKNNDKNLITQYASSSRNHGKNVISDFLSPQKNAEGFIRICTIFIGVFVILKGAQFLIGSLSQGWFAKYEILAVVPIFFSVLLIAVIPIVLFILLSGRIIKKK